MGCRALKLELHSFKFGDGFYSHLIFKRCSYWGWSDPFSQSCHMEVGIESSLTNLGLGLGV